MFSSMRSHFDPKRRCSCCCSFWELFDHLSLNACVWSSYQRHFSPSRTHRFYSFQQRLVVAQIQHGACVCVLLCFINPMFGNQYSPGVIPEIRGPGVAGSSPSTLTTSLAIPVPSSSSLNGPKTTTLTTRGLCPGGSVVWAGPKFVRPHW